MKILFILLAGAILGGCVPAQRADDNAYCVYYYSTVPIRAVSTAVVTVVIGPGCGVEYLVEQVRPENTKHSYREEFYKSIEFCWGRR